ncbi:MAG TPA: hypothetical protein IAB59_05610 [Candidatus Onthousia faecipullorum]|uniref:Uncharacterized protein n=1 Tax=Candidatus Onthousia faecipullorum TaxID=2840887 RepID=A0A9D1KB42_9FIRM|nr:hypothetical protein [Candidatus Onthousia faecipullorum]
MANLELFKELEDNKDELNNFLNTSSKTILDEHITVELTLINQLLGHFRSLLVRAQDIISKEILEEYSNYQKDISSQLDSLNKENNGNNKLNSLTTIYNILNNYYQELNNKVLDGLSNSNVTDYNTLLRKANLKIVELNNNNISIEDIESIIPLYNEVNTTKDINKLKEFLSDLDSLLINNNSSLNQKQGEVNERVFSLFAKINDQIIDSSYLNINNLVYALYTLEDSSKYYAIIKNKEEIEILDQSFSNLPCLFLTKDNIIDTCKIIIKNASIYYDLNEYMRYIEKSYKNNITKEIDEIILKYKTRLQELESIIKVQLDFIDDIALLVNNKPCNKYPNVTYNGVSKDEFFSNYNLEKDSRLQEIERLIIEVLLNPDIKSEFNTKNILKTLYDSNTISNLLSSNYISNNIKPNLNKEDIISKNIDTTSNIKTNSLKIKDYLESRINELDLLSSSPKINVTITKSDNALFKDINTILDLHTAIVICDKVYKKGQGAYAVIDYLKTGNTLKFTSKYKARDLASTVNRNLYLKLLLENIFKRYLYLKNDNNNLNSFVESILTNNFINSKEIVKSLLENEQLLIDSINNFDYEYLDSTSFKFNKIEELLNNKEDLRILAINKILEDIKRTEKLID